MAMERPAGEPVGTPEKAVQAISAWAYASSTCNFVRMGGSECSVRLIGPSTIARQAALIYRFDKIGCTTTPGILAVVSTKDRILIVIAQGDENSPGVKRFLASLRIN